MYSLQTIEATCGAKLAAYVQNKSRGGRAGQKGPRYEDRFALLKIAEAAQNAFIPNGDFVNSRNVSFRSQMLCFVDDLVVYHPRARTAQHFQAKNQAKTSWGSGPKSLAADFRNQLKLGKSAKIKTAVILVVNSKRMAQKLRESMPKRLRAEASVYYFPSDTSVLALLKHKPMKVGLTGLLGPDPSNDHLVSAAWLLLGVWEEAQNTITLKKILSELHKKGAPLIRPLKPVKELDPMLRTVLDRIPNFGYTLEKGFMTWQYGTTDRGSFQKHCGTAEFASFAQQVIGNRPETFEDLEAMLG